MAVRINVGFYGKLPSHGDFLRRRVSDAFVTVWDGWLQACLAASRSQLAGQWLEVYLTSPAWRFAAVPGIFGPAPVIGLMVPSVDRVGRYFYLTLVAELDAGVSVVTAATDASPFFEAAERLILETLDSDPLDFERFDEQVVSLGDGLGSSLAPSSPVLEPETSRLVLEGGGAAWQIPMGSSRQLPAVFGQLLGQRLSALYAPLTLWWTDGSAAVEPSCLVLEGMPAPGAFASFLDGSWAARAWQSIPALTAGVASPELLVEDLSVPRFHSAGATNVGRVRKINQDSFLERPEVGLWAVADGLGGHQDGEVASRMVCDALADFEPHAGFEDMVEAAGQRVREVNDQLIRASVRTDHATRSGSTVVALLARGSRCAVLWAGDSRVYRWRGGQLAQLTRDHSLAEINGVPSTAITRAVGGEETLALERHSDRVHVGDRFLLCSDGLTRAVSEAQIQALMERPDIGAAVDGLIEATLEAGAPDNVTALIVEAFS